MKCEKCGGQVYIVESVGHEMDDDLYRSNYTGRCVDCGAKFLYTDYFKMEYIGTDYKEI